MVPKCRPSGSFEVLALGQFHFCGWFYFPQPTNQPPLSLSLYSAGRGAVATPAFCFEETVLHCCELCCTVLQLLWESEPCSIGERGTVYHCALLGEARGEAWKPPSVSHMCSSLSTSVSHMCRSHNLQVYLACLQFSSVSRPHMHWLQFGCFGPCITLTCVQCAYRYQHTTSIQNSELHTVHTVHRCVDNQSHCRSAGHCLAVHHCDYLVSLWLLWPLHHCNRGKWTQQLWIQINYAPSDMLIQLITYWRRSNKSL